MTNLTRKRILTVALVAVASLLSACDNNSSAPPPPAPPPPPPPVAMASFSVTLSNLTNAQPLSPVAVIAHQDGYRAFEVGTPASPGLEDLAEGGAPDMFIAEATADAAVLATMAGSAPIPPGQSDSIVISVPETELTNLRLSAMTMLVNTNDAFSGLNAVSVGALADGETLMMRSIAYDAGTELNTEAATDIPGPAANGEGFNALRDDRQDAVKMHPGVVTSSDGLASSGLSEAHRFDNPVVQITVTRTD